MGHSFGFEKKTAETMIIFIILFIGQFGYTFGNPTEKPEPSKVPEVDSSMSTNSCVEHLDYSKKCLNLVSHRLKALAKFYDLLTVSKEFSDPFPQKRSPSSTITGLERMIMKVKMNEARARERAAIQAFQNGGISGFDY